MRIGVSSDKALIRFRDRMATKMKAELIFGLIAVIGFVGERAAPSEELALPATAKSVRKVVSDGRHNAFAAFTKWKGDYWLAFRKGTGHVSRDGDLVVLRTPPYKEWKQRPAGIHLSGHAVYTFNGVTYLIGRYLGYDPPADPETPRSKASGRKLDQATMVYTYEQGQLKPYCLLGSLDGNRDSSYATAVRDGRDMLIVYHRAAHEFAGEFRAKDAADLFLARVPLKQ